MTSTDEERLRRAVRYVVLRSRVHNADDVQYVFDLWPYLREEASVVVADECARTLAEIVGGD
jgi:hypothetical protein